MIFLKKYPYNFKFLILGRGVRNIGDSFYAVAITIGLVNVYNINAGNLSLFSIFSIIFLLIPQLYSNILVLGIILNMLTIFFDITIFLRILLKKQFN